MTSKYHVSLTNVSDFRVYVCLRISLGEKNHFVETLILENNCAYYISKIRHNTQIKTII